MLGKKTFLYNLIESLAYFKNFNFFTLPSVHNLKNSSNTELFIVANGHSLHADIAEYKSFITKKDILMLNNSIQHSLFDELKPKYYLLMDSMYFVQDLYKDVSKDTYEYMSHSINKTLNAFNSIKLNMILFVPSVWIDKISIQNPNITLHTYSVSTLKSFHWLEKFLFQRGLAIPCCNCVLIPAIICAIAMGYKTIYLLGCNQDTFLNYYIDNSNLLKIKGYKHFYREKEVEMISNYSIGEKLEHESDIFKAYSKINKLFSNHKIINLSSVSMIDAFPRDNLANIID